MSIDKALPTNVTTIALAGMTGTCAAERWAALTTSAVADRIKGLHALNKKYVMTVGGSAGKFTCGANADFRTFINRYYTNSMVGIDFSERPSAAQPGLMLACAAAPAPGWRQLPCPCRPRRAPPDRPPLSGASSLFTTADIQTTHTQAEIEALVARARDILLVYPQLRIT